LEEGEFRRNIEQKNSIFSVPVLISISLSVVERTVEALAVSKPSHRSEDEETGYN
jgi:hypothetical protein